MNAPLSFSQLQAYSRDQRDTNREELSRILDAEGMTSVLDLLAELASGNSDHSGDRWERIAGVVQRAATDCEHRTGEF